MNHASDHETGNHKEDFNTEMPAQDGQSSMTGHNQQNRDCSKPLDVRSAAFAHSPFSGLSPSFQVKHRLSFTRTCVV